MPKVPNVDISKIERPTITKDRENPDKKYVMATVDGKFMKKEISKQRWDRMWLADDMSAYKKAIAAVAFAPFLKENVQTEKTAEKGKQSVENGQQESDMKENKVEGASQSPSEKEEENQSNLKQKVRSLHLN